jgi:histidinol-phosphatase (PHP family)
MKHNYHTHTTRCHHAEGSDEDYIIKAIEEGYQTLGFSDHAPWPKHANETQFIRMAPSDFKDYVDSIRRLGRQYGAKIDILCGLEAEYYPERLDYLIKLKEETPLDYLVLGNHFKDYESHGTYFGSYKDSHKVIEDYKKLSIEALRTGLYKIFAHPDIFVRSLSVWNQEAIDAVYEICKVAKENGVILEYNLGGVRFRRKDLDYPYTPFWKIVAEVGNAVIIGVDAHSPSDLGRLDTIEKAEAVLKECGIVPIERIEFK